MTTDYCNVSGTDQGSRPKEIFVWCRAKGRADFDLVKTGHAVGADDVSPPGIRVGQFSITFELPADCVVDSIFVTSDKSAERPLRDVVVTPIS